jgi:hypothetical protein
VVSHIADAGLANGPIGDIVAHIATLGGGDLSALNISDIGHGITAGLAGNITSTISGLTGDLLHSVDLSDVGAMLHAQPVHDVVASNLDLDQLTSKVNLFDLGHLDLGHDIHHS